jgi:hypothetical protein
VFRGLIDHAKAAAANLVLKYLARASVAIPFLIALGFALAAITAMLVQRYGQISAYWMVAGGLAAVGVVAAVAVTAKEHGDEAAAEQAEPAADDASTSTSGLGVSSETLLQVPMAILGAILTAPGGPSSAFRVARLLGRNFPLVLLLVMISGLFWPAEDEDKAQGTAEVGGEGKPNGHHADIYH